MTLLTNLKFKTGQTITGILFFTILTTVFSMDVYSSSIRFFAAGDFHGMNRSEFISRDANYENRIGEERILRPLIQSDVITSDHIRLFIPWYQREAQARDQICGTAEVPGNLTPEKNQTSSVVLKMNVCLTTINFISIALL